VPSRVPIPWPRIFAEGLVIVVSILLALGADAWWDGRQRRIDELASLELIARDLQVTMGQLTDFDTLMERSVTASLAAYAALSSPTSDIDRDAVSRQLVSASLRRTVRLPSAAYTDLLSTGNIRIIRDRELRDQIIRFYEAAGRTQEILDRNNAVFVDDLQYTQLFGRGLVLVRPGASTGVGAIDAAGDTVSAHLGQGFDHGEDPLWSYRPNSPEWNAVRGTLMMFARGITASRGVAAELREDASALHTAVQEHLGHHWRVGRVRGGE